MLWARAIVVYLVTVLILRFLGRALQFQAKPYDVAVQVLLGSAAANLIVDQNIEIWRAFTALGTLAVLHTIISLLSLWNPLKQLLVGKPEVLLENGTIIKSNLIKHQISVDELLAALRQKGYSNLADIEFAQLEPSGKVSVIPKSQSRPVTPKDLNLSTRYEGYSCTLIADKKVDLHNLRKVGLDMPWLLNALQAQGVTDPSDVLLATLDTQGQLVVVRDQDVSFVRALVQGSRAQTSPGLPPKIGHDPPPGQAH